MKMMYTFLLSILTLIFVIPYSNAQERGGPIDPCEENDQLVADRYSCTRYHVCRQMEGTDEYTTDISICPENLIFDMVTSFCVGSETGFLQDPAGCTTFYGCHPTKETSEGFLRRHYTCPGDLRFNPEVKHCTFKTNVTDNLCNSRDPDQRIIGDVLRIASNDNGNKFVSRGDTSSILFNSPKVARPKYQDSKPSPLSRLTQSALIANQINKIKDAGKVGNPAGSSNLDHIAQVISGQLLSLQNRVTSVKDKPKPAEKKDKKEDVVQMVQKIQNVQKDQNATKEKPKNEAENKTK